MDKFVLELHNVHYDSLSAEAFQFNLSITCEYIKEWDKQILRQIAEMQVVSYMIATGQNFLRDHESLLEYLNNYTLSNFIKVVEIGETTVTAFPIELEKTDKSIKITTSKKERISVTTK